MVYSYNQNCGNQLEFVWNLIGIYTFTFRIWFYHTNQQTLGRRKRVSCKVTDSCQGFSHYSRKKPVTEPKRSIREGIEMVDEFLKLCRDALTTEGPEGTVSNKCLKSLELLKRSLSNLETNIKSLSSYPSFHMKLNLESLLTWTAENQHALSHFKRDPFTLPREYALIFCTSVEEDVKRASKWSAAYVTHPNELLLLQFTVVRCLSFVSDRRS